MAARRAYWRTHASLLSRITMLFTQGVLPFSSMIGYEETRHLALQL